MDDYIENLIGDYIFAGYVYESEAVDVAILTISDEVKPDLALCIHKDIYKAKTVVYLITLLADEVFE